MRHRDFKRKPLQYQAQHGQLIRLADALHTSLDLPLADLIAASDVIDRFDAIPITLMNGFDAHIACSAIGTGRFAHTDGIARGSGLCEAGSLGLIARAVAQVVQV